ncbi:hypothetical protein H175_ch2624 [Bacillus thuringiensis serovar thuringiensis str. IS5056]|nr:hypothetical protein H175_ch2624 [Bacillus thuringiensis serovar thuringiensis str. IS5056]
MCYLVSLGCPHLPPLFIYYRAALLHYVLLFVMFLVMALNA